MSEKKELFIPEGNYNTGKEKNEIIGSGKAIENIEKLIEKSGETEARTKLLYAYKKDPGFDGHDMYYAYKVCDYTKTYKYDMKDIGERYANFVKYRDRTYNLMMDGKEDTDEYNTLRILRDNYLYVTPKMDDEDCGCKGDHDTCTDGDDCECEGHGEPEIGEYDFSHVKKVLKTIENEAPFRNANKYNYTNKYGLYNKTFKEEISSYELEDFQLEGEYLLGTYETRGAEIPNYTSDTKKGIEQLKIKVFESGLVEKYCATSQHLIHGVFKTLDLMNEVVRSLHGKKADKDHILHSTGAIQEQIRGILELIDYRVNTCKISNRDFDYPGRKGIPYNADPEDYKDDD